MQLWDHHKSASHNGHRPLCRSPRPTVGSLIMADCQGHSPRLTVRFTYQGRLSGSLTKADCQGHSPRLTVRAAVPLTTEAPEALWPLSAGRRSGPLWWRQLTLPALQHHYPRCRIPRWCQRNAKGTKKKNCVNQ